jgi:GTPase SAR1 family protein
LKEDYLNTLPPGKEFVRLILVGPLGAGKSSLLYRFLNPTSPSCHLYGSRDSYTKRVFVGGKVVQLILRDMKFGSHHMHRQKKKLWSNGIILVYDITDMDSFLKMQLVYRCCLRIRPDLAVLVVCGNKSDLEEQRQVPVEWGKQFARSISTSFVDTSVKTRYNVEELFVVATSNALERKHRFFCGCIIT